MKNMICKICAVVVAATSMMSMGFLNVAAVGDITDYPWSVGGNDLRRKYDSTSIYVKNEGGTSVYMNVYGKVSPTDIYKQGVGTKGNTSYQTYGITIPGNSERLVRQFINELGYKYAYVEFWSTSANSSSGVWSPDSVGSYTNAN